MVPEGWSASTLGELADVQRGKFSARPRNDPAFFGGEYPFVQTGDVSKSSIRLTGHSQTLNDSGLAVSKIFPADTILMTIAANIGDVAITTYPVACPDSLVGIIPHSDKAEPIWLLHALMIEKEGLDRSAPKMAQKNINLEVLRPLRLLSPPLPEQRKIADILSTWDAAIEKTEALLATAKAQKRALMQSLLTGKRRFPAFEGEPWKEVRLGDVVKIDWGNTSITKKSYVESGVPAYSATGRDGFVEEAEMSGPGIVLSAIGARCGRCFWADEEWTAIKNTIVLQGIEGRCELRFIFQIVNDARYWPISGGAQPFIGLKNARNAKLSLPSVEEQLRIADALETADREVAICDDYITKLRTEKKALMQQLLTGKRRVVV